MNPAILSMLERYKCVTMQEYENALKEIMQEIALLGLWRSKFFEHAAFYGGTDLRILYGLDRFSEDLDFSLLKPQKNFNLKTYIAAVESELTSMGFSVTVEEREKKRRYGNRVRIYKGRHQRALDKNHGAGDHRRPSSEKQACESKI